MIKSFFNGLLIYGLKFILIYLCSFISCRQKRAICKSRHWNLSIGIGIGIGTDITNAIIYSSIRPMDPKLSRVVTRMRGLHPQSHVTLRYCVTWQIKNVISPPSQGLWTPNLAGWWFSMMGSHLQTHMTHQPWGHVTNQKTFYLQYESQI